MMTDDSDASTEIRDRYRRIADGFEARLRGVTAEQWKLPTPCREWDVSQLVAHVVTTYRRVAAQAGGPEPVAVDPGEDLTAAWRAARAEVASALDDPGRARMTTGSMFGQQSFQSLVGGLLCTDTLYHTWDLARATGQDEHLDPDDCAQTLAFIEPLDEAIRRRGGFAPKITPVPGADVQTRMLNFGGRSTDWSAEHA